MNSVCLKLFVATGSIVPRAAKQVFISQFHGFQPFWHDTIRYDRRD